MSVKTIFREGMKERRRRKSLGRTGNEFRKKEKTLADQLTALGQKAWQAKTDISAFADLQAALGAAQKTLDELKIQEELLQKQKQEIEERKKQENDRLAAAQKEAEEKKRDMDRRLGEQQNTLQAGQKEVQKSRDRLAAIARERSQLQSKSAVPETGAAEKSEMAKGMELLDNEATALQTRINACETSGKPVAALVSQLQEESNQMRKRLDDLRLEQKQVISDLDKKIAALKNDLAKNGEKAHEADNKRTLSYQSLGEKLADSNNASPALAGEMAAVTAARSEKEGVQAMIGGLERQKDEGQVSAYKKMVAILVGGIILLAAVVIVLFLLLAPKKKPTPLEGLLQGQAEVMQKAGEMIGELQKGLAGQADLNEEAATAAAPEAGKAIVDEIMVAFDQCVAAAADLARDKPEAAVLLPQLEKLYADYGEKMIALNAKFLALKDQDIFEFRRANGYMTDSRLKHVFAKDNALSQAIAYYNFEKGEQAVVDMLANKIVKLLDDAAKQ